MTEQHGPLGKLHNLTPAEKMGEDEVSLGWPSDSNNCNRPPPVAASHFVDATAPTSQTGGQAGGMNARMRHRPNSSIVRPRICSLSRFVHLVAQHERRRIMQANSVVGVGLIALGILAFSIHSITYFTTEHVAGPL